ncbi:hypothetical protein TcWFU_009658 [Taenia crassiceps]|uniref:PH domain-containing protein n=1 Tax=Taenia crassiceps TaxID=6207 RepID=A0ABR4Q8K3_9CEST
MFTLSVDPLQPGWFSAKFYPRDGHGVTQRQVLDGFLQSGRPSKIRPLHNVSTQVTPTLVTIPEYPSSSSSLSAVNQPSLENMEVIRSCEFVDANRHERVGVCIVRSHSASLEQCRAYTKSQQTATFLVYSRNRWYLCRQKLGCSPKMICEINRMMFNSSTQVQEDEITSLRDVEVQTVGTYEDVMMDYKLAKAKRMQNRACGDDSSSTTVVTIEDVDVEGDMGTCEVTIEVDRRSILSRTSFTASETLDQITTDSAFASKMMRKTKASKNLLWKAPRGGYLGRLNEVMGANADNLSTALKINQASNLAGRTGLLDDVFGAQGRSSSSPKRSIDIRAVSSFLAFGPVLHQVPCKPSVFSESDIDRSFGVPHEAHQGTAVTFFRCSSQAEMASWMDAVNRLLFGNMGANPGIVPQQTVPVQSGPYQSYGPPFGGYPSQPTIAPPPLPPGIANYPGPAQPLPYVQPPMPTSMGAPYSAPQPMQPPPGTPYGVYPATSQPVAGPSYNYYPSPQQSMPSQQNQQQQQQQVLYDKNGKPYTIVYKDGKPKKKKWKKAALGLAAGAATGYVAGKMFGGLGRALGYGLGGWGGGWGRPCYGGGFGRWGSWSSLSSFSSSGGWSS